MWRAIWRVARGPSGLLQWLFGIALLGSLIAALGAIGLAWRLAQGPLDVTWLVRAAESIRGGSTPARLTVARASIAWDGFHGRGHRGLELRLHDLHAVDEAGATTARVAQADVTLAALPLLTATIVPRRVVLDGVEIRSVRGADGALRLDVGGAEASDQGGSGTGVRDLLAELRRPVGSEHSEPSLASLEQIVIAHAHVTVLDQETMVSLQGDVSDLDLRRREGGGITGSAEGRAMLGDIALAVRLKADLLPAGGTHAELSLLPLATRPIDSIALGKIDPALAGLGVLDTTVQAQVSLDLSPALRPERASLAVSTGAGTLAVPNSAPVVFDRAAVTASARWDGESWKPVAVQVDPLELVVAAASGKRSTARLTAQASLAAGHWTVRTALAVDRAEFADLPSLWPYAWGGHVRPWMVDNVVAGSAHDAALTATIDVPEDDPKRAKLTAEGGTLQADNLVIYWLRPVPPVDHAQATLTITGVDTMMITVPRAQQGPIVLTDGVLQFTGMSHKDQYLALTLAVQGGVPDLLKLLREKGLHLLDAHPLPITGSAGKAVARLAVNVPMFDHLRFDQVSIASKGRLTGLRLDGLVGGRDLTDGDVTYDVTQDSMTASGAATVDGLPGQVEVGMDFRGGGPTEIVQRARFVGPIGAAALAAHGIDTAGVLTGGTGQVDATYREQRDGVARVSAQADLTAAGLAVAGWRKPPGAAARAAVSLNLLHGAVTGAPQLSASGPGLEIVAQAEMADGALRVLRVPKVVLGPTRLSGEVAFPAGPNGVLRIKATGPELDVADQIKRLTDGGGVGAAGGRSWIVDLRFGRVSLGGGRALTDLVVHAESIGGKLRALQATTEGAEQLRASITPVANGRRLQVQAADTGALLRGLDLTGVVHGGRLAVDANYDDRFADPPLEGRLELGQFSVRDEVVLGKLLQAVTIYGIVDALRGQGVYFADALVPFCLCQNQLRLGPSRASSASLGITAQGSLDFDRKTMAITGTVVPAYVVNAALGRLPLIGRLFSSERGGGLIAADFTLSGPIGSPAVNVNPLSLLTPGILRRLFGLFG